MLIINKETVDAIRQKLSAPEKKQEVVDDVERMLNIKQTLFWRADAGSCGGSLCNLASQRDREVYLLEDILTALESNDNPRADFLLGEYANSLGERDGTEPKHC